VQQISKGHIPLRYPGRRPGLRPASWSATLLVQASCVIGQIPARYRLQTWSATWSQTCSELEFGLWRANTS